MDFLQGFIGLLPNFSGGITFLDIIILLIILFYVHEGYSLGFLLASLDLLSFIISFIAALQFYTKLSLLLITLFGLSIGISHAVSFFLIAVVSEIILNIVFRKIAQRIPSFIPWKSLRSFLTDTNHMLGIIPGLLSSFILLSFLLTLLVTFPSAPYLKDAVDKSAFGSKLVSNTSLVEKQLNIIFGGALDETLNFMTVDPKSEKTVSLHFTVTNGTVDEEAEGEMLSLVNQERVKNGLQKVVFDERLRSIARAHSQDMFTHGYFSHQSLDGRSPFERMDDADIHYIYAGENLALSPTTGLAMQGLMNSPGHRANILNPNFNKLGIGVINGGIYGKMYTQEFSN